MIIPTFRRAGKVTTLKAVSHAALCVTASEESDYRRHYPDVEIIVHPDTVLGYSPKAQWILDRYPNCFLLDDDQPFMVRKYIGTGDARSQKIDPDTAYDIIQQTAATAKEMGAYLFGFSSVPNPVTYHGFKIFRFTGFIVGGACGYLEGGGLYFDCSFTAVSDFWMALYNAYTNRFCFVDERYCVSGDSKAQTFESLGGIASLRTQETERRDFERLKAYFGKAVDRKSNGPDTIRKMRNPYEKTIHLPY